MTAVMNWLNKPYFFIESKTARLGLVVSFGLFTYLFLLIYEPFTVSEVSGEKAVFLAGFGLMVSFGLAFTYFVLPALFPHLFISDRWKVKKEIIYLLASFILIAFLNYTYNYFVGQNIAPQHSLPYFIGKTLGVGVFPLIVMIFLIERRLNGQKETKPGKTQMISIKPETLKGKTLEFNLDQFLFAESDNNYTTFYQLGEGGISKELLRVSIKNVETQLQSEKTLIRCHRSFIINKLHIESISGNNRSRHVRLRHYDQLIPISRSLSKEALH